MGIAVLGPVSVDGSTERLGRRDRVVLTALAVRAGHTVAADELADAIWHDGPPPSAAKVVQGCIVRLRKILGGEAIRTLPGGYRLDVALDEVDAHRFEQAVKRARELLALGETERAAYVLSEGVALWRGRALSDLEDWDAGRVEASRLEEVRREALELRLEARLRAGHHAEVLGEAQAMVNDAPLRERRWALLALALYQDGQQAAALRTLQQLKGVLHRELGLDPGPDITKLEHAILNQDPSLIADAALPSSAIICPFQGLVPFDVDDAENFFGRDEQVEECVARLHRDGILVVAGPSGCGKSSLVRAGIAARLRRAGARVDVITPGGHPVDTLLSVSPGRGRIVVVDQFEELFTLTGASDQRQEFLDALVDRARTSQLVVALRADRLGDISVHAEFAGLVERGLFVLVAMDAAGLRAAIDEPARQAGLLVEAGLVDLLVNEVENEPGALPLLSHALRETWLRREGRTLTVDGYRASGGIRGSIAQSAEAVYQQAEPEQRTHLHALMLRLVAPGSEGEPVRTRLPRRQVVTEGHAELVDRLVASRLVTSDADVVEVAHEALVRSWPRLREWLDEDVDGQRILHHLAEAADAWHSLGRPESELYRGVRLARAIEWRDRTAPSLTQVEREFLDASRTLSEHELRAAEERARASARTNRTLRALLAVAVVLVVVAASATWYAVGEGNDAERSRDAAQSAATTELARRVGARALLTEGISHSLLLAAHGARLDDSPETRVNLMAAMGERPRLVWSAPSGAGYVDAMTLSPDGRRIYAGSGTPTFFVYDADTGGVVDSYSFDAAEDEEVYVAPTLSPDGRFVAAMGNGDRAVRLLEPDTLSEVETRLAVPDTTDLSPYYFGFSADGQNLAASFIEKPGAEERPVDKEAFALVWDLDHPTLAPKRVTLPNGGQGVALSPDGATVYSQWPMAAFDVGSGRRLWQRPNINGWLHLEISPDGTMLASERREDDDTSPEITLIDAATGETVRVLRDQDNAPRDLAFSRDGTLLGSASHHGEVIVWDVATGEPRAQISTFEVAWSVGFSPDNQTVYTGGDEGMLRAYDLSGERSYVTRTEGVPARDYLHAVPSPDGGRTAYVWREAGDSWLTIRNEETGATTRPEALHAYVFPPPWPPMAWHPDGSRLAVYDGGVVVVADADSGEVVARRKVVEPEIYSMAYVEGGEQLVVGDSRSQTTFVDADTLRPTGPAADIPGDCCTVSSPDGRTTVFFDDDATGAEEHWRAVDTSTGKVVSEGELKLRINYATYSPDGRGVAVTGISGEVMVIDVASGRVLRAAATPHGGPGYLIRYAADGQRLVSGADDGTVALWNARTLDLLGSVAVTVDAEHTSVSPRFLSGHDVVAIAGLDGTTYEWDTRLGPAVAFACRMAGRNLTREEWTQAFDDRPYEQTCPQAAELSGGGSAIAH